MTTLSTRDFIDYVNRSKLVEANLLRTALADIKEAAGGAWPQDPWEIAEQLIARGMLSRWQCAKLMERKYKGFFLGKYKLLGHIGAGGMSTVYLAEHVHMHRRVAIKVLPQAKIKDSSYLQRFYREGRAVASLDHPNIVRAYDIDSQGKSHYLVMEFVPGQDLQAVVRKSHEPMDCQRAANLIAQAALGLQHAHQAGLIHRDVKPANLLIDDSGRVKILDLGLALFSAEEKSSLTMAHDERVMGTADYLSPEQALNSHDVDSRSDIYSLGCSLYFALTGRPPFHEGPLAQRIAQHQNAEPDDVGVLRAECPARLAEICKRMMAKKPEDRYQSAAEVAQALSDWIVQNGGQPISSGNSHAMMPSNGERAASESLAATIKVDTSSGDTAKQNEKGPSSKLAEKRKLPEPEPVVVGLPGSAVTNSQFVDPAVIQREVEPPPAKSLLEARRSSGRRVRKPPVLMWVVMGLLTLVCIGMAIHFFFLRS